MTDYFALLNQPRRPWLDPEELKQVFHARTLQAHPDAQAKPTGNESFTQLNEAYQVLRDPKRRLHHLLSLDGNPPAASISIPAEIEQLFPAVAELTQEADGVIRRMTNSTNALSRSLIRPVLLGTAERIKRMLETLTQLHDHAVMELQELNRSWRPDETDHRPELHTLYLQFSYLTKWISELEEKHLQLTGGL